MKALLVCCSINKFTKTLEFVEDRIGARGPHKRPLVGIVVSYVVVDLVHQFTHAAEGAAPDRLLSDEREPALDLVEPAGVGGSVMDVVARPAREPGFDRGVFVSAVVVGNQVDLELGGDAAVEMIEKGQELLMAMARLALRDDRAVKHVERREQSGGTVAKVVVGYAFDITPSHRQHRLGPLQRLDLALFVHTQHQGLVRRIEIEPGDVAHFLHEERVGGELETFAAVRLQAETGRSSAPRCSWRWRFPRPPRAPSSVAAAGLLCSTRLISIATCSSR